MEKVYVFGHRKPDTDSVCAAISLAYLKKQQGINAIPYTLGEINNETKFVLDYFKVTSPSVLYDVKLQIKDVKYHRNVSLSDNTSIRNVYKYLEKNSITGVPIVNKNNKFISLITLKGITKDLIDGNFNVLNTNYKNIVDTLEGEEVLKYDDEIFGNLKVASYKSTTFFEKIDLKEDDILIVGDRHSIIEYAVQSKIKLIIVVGNGVIKDKHLEMARENKVNIIRTSYDTYHTARLIGLSNYIKTLIKEGRICTFKEDDYYNEFLIKSSKLRHNNYPIINKNDKCLGLLRITDINDIKRKKVILVDHNEEEQSVEGLDEAEIVEIVDHHKIGNVSTKNPINFRNMSVGSTNTIIYHMYQEQKIDIPDYIRGLILSGILSDTLSLTSPTTTSIDKEVVIKLANSLNIDYKKYAREMFKAGTSLSGMTINEIINKDIKSFSLGDNKFAISQVFTLNFEDIYNNKDKYIEELEHIKQNKELNLVVLAVTDILKNGSYIFYTENEKEILEDALGMIDIEQGIYVDGMVSRKKQIVPIIMDNIR